MKQQKNRNGSQGNKWIADVLERDKNTCQHCGSKDRLEAHHVVEWDESEELRFEISNGLTLCKSCHMSHHMKVNPNLKTPEIPWNKGLKGLKIGTIKGTKFTEEHKRKLSEAKLGKPSWNSGLTGWMSEEVKEKNKKRCKGRTWIICPETGKRKWMDA